MRFSHLTLAQVSSSFATAASWPTRAPVYLSSAAPLAITRSPKACWAGGKPVSWQPFVWGEKASQQFFWSSQQVATCYPTLFFPVKMPPQRAHRSQGPPLAQGSLWAASLTRKAQDPPGCTGCSSPSPEAAGRLRARSTAQGWPQGCVWHGNSSVQLGAERPAEI